MSVEKLSVGRRSFIAVGSMGLVFAVSGYAPFLNAAFANGISSNFGGIAATTIDGLQLSASDQIFAKLLNTIRDQRPSTLNYATPYFIGDPTKFCIPVTPPANGAPIATTMPPLKVGTNVHVPPIEFVLQVTDVAISFGVDNVGLPPSMQPLPPQQIAAKISFVARTQVPRLDPSSLGFPNDPHQFDHLTFSNDLTPPFPVSLFVTLSTRFVEQNKTSWVAFAVEKFDTTVIQPSGLGAALDDIVVLILDTEVIPNIWPMLSPMIMDITKLAPAGSPARFITLTPTPNSTPPNPAVGGDILQVSFDMGVSLT